MKRTIRIYAFITLLCLLFQFNAFASTNYSISTLSKNELVFKEESLSDAFDDIFPFIFTTVDAFSFYPNFFDGSDSYVQGYLYFKNLSTGDITIALAENVNEISLCNNYIYCIIDSQEIARINLLNNDLEYIFSSSGQKICNIKASQDMIFFINGNEVTLLEPVSLSTRCLYKNNNIKYLYPLTSESFAWIDNNNISYKYSTHSKVSIPIDFNALFDGTHMQNLAYANTSTVALMSTAAPTLPLSSYPIGSYFTNNGSACTHHGTGSCDYYGNCNCKSFANSIQCMGFAKYVFANCAHLSSWSPTNHSNGNLYSFNSAQAKTFLSALSRGSYLRLTSYSGSGHSVIVMQITNTSVTVYEANYSGPCQVGTRTLTYSQFASQYSAITEAYSHSFTRYNKYSSTYHKTICSITGCGGYVLQRHYAQTPGQNATCLACGYVGNITEGTQSFFGGVTQ